MALGAGDLSRRVVLKQPVVSRVAGSKETTYTDAFTAFANIERTDSRRAIERGATVLLNTDRVTIRVAAERLLITEDWLVFYDNRNHAITAIDIKDNYITLTTKE